MPFSRYKVTISDPERLRLTGLIEGLPHKPEGEAWENFMADNIGLPMCYGRGVRKVLDQGRWRTKPDPVDFIRQSAQRAVFASIGLKEERKDRRTDYAGNISDLRLPDFPDQDDASARGFHDRAVDFLWSKYGPSIEREDPPHRGIALDVLEPELLDELASGLVTNWDDPDLWKVNFDRVADKVGLDKGERKILKLKLAGESLDSVIARQRTPEKRRAVQAARRRLDRKMPKIIEAIKAPPPSAEVSVPPAPRVVPADAPTAIEVLRRHQENRTRNATNEPHRPITLPVYPESSR
ncbi:MAG: hypothetical protein ABSB35_29470 [Bryobacteraceae bacterium]|jgi:hypothetical protein